MTPITPKITMSWGLSFLCIPCATACADMIPTKAKGRNADACSTEVSKRDDSQKNQGRSSKPAALSRFLK